MIFKKKTIYKERISLSHDFLSHAQNGIDADRFVTSFKKVSNFFLSSKKQREKKRRNLRMKLQTNAEKKASHLVRFPLDNFKFFELSFQSSFQLSLAVLVCYRSFVGIFSLGWNLPPILRLHSQATRLTERKKCNTVPPPNWHQKTHPLYHILSLFAKEREKREGRVNIEQDFNPL